MCRGGPGTGSRTLGPREGVGPKTYGHSGRMLLEYLCSSYKENEYEEDGNYM